MLESGLLSLAALAQQPTAGCNVVQQTDQHHDALCILVLLCLAAGLAATLIGCPLRNEQHSVLVDGHLQLVYAN